MLVFLQVPPCICSFTDLHSLNLSDNEDIVELPAEMGRLDKLVTLKLSGLKDLREIPEKFQAAVKSD